MVNTAAMVHPPATMITIAARISLAVHLLGWSEKPAERHQIVIGAVFATHGLNRLTDRILFFALRFFEIE